MSNLHYYQLLKEKFTTKEAVLTEIINLEAIMELPKGTEHFVSDLHGEYTAFNHVMRNGSGSIKEKIHQCFEGRHDIDVDDLAVLIYYPTGKLNLEESLQNPTSLTHWYKERLHQLLVLALFASSKYTKSKVRKALDPNFRYIIEELLYEVNPSLNKQDYYTAIVSKIIELGQAKPLIRSLCITIQHLVVDHLHVVGDIYDRGPQPDKIIDRLMQVPSLDIQWGNHDIIWMATLAGSWVSIANVLRISARYGNLDTLEEAYGINLRPLIDYAYNYYKPQDKFNPNVDLSAFSNRELDLLNRVQQACAILQFKLEGQLYHRRPEFNMGKRDLLSRINPQDMTLTLDKVDHTLTNFHAPTIDWANPTTLTDEEVELMERLTSSFTSSDRLRKHINFLLEKGRIYLVYNNNLLIHGCIPMHVNGDFKSLRIGNDSYSGKSLLDFYEQQVRFSFLNPSIKDDLATDMLWYLWCGESSSLFGKDAMKTFERYYINDKATHSEIKDPYYRLRNEEVHCLSILNAFGLDSSAHIINGHTPVKEKDGENPIKGQGRLIVIDGGFSKAYHKETGIGGYTLLYNSWGMQLVAHQPFETEEDAVTSKIDIVSVKRLVDKVDQRIKVRETTVGERLMKEVQALRVLYDGYETY